MGQFRNWLRLRSCSVLLSLTCFVSPAQTAFTLAKVGGTCDTQKRKDVKGNRHEIIDTVSGDMSGSGPVNSQQQLLGPPGAERPGEVLWKGDHMANLDAIPRFFRARNCGSLWCWIYQQEYSLLWEPWLVCPSANVLGSQEKLRESFWPDIYVDFVRAPASEAFFRSGHKYGGSSVKPSVLCSRRG